MLHLCKCTTDVLSINDHNNPDDIVIGAEFQMLAGHFSQTASKSLIIMILITLLITTIIKETLFVINLCL